ncbi:MAG: hypothetical protein BRC30_00205 [Nanohaloarchaea archaeon SW_7_46_7]|nr:MAG: hypothetical protein BRC30_00205 [Nanohaloarchaea archaeon SW_7_46_7]
MKVLNIVGTAREGRKSVHVARQVDKAFEERGHETEIFDLAEEKFPPLGNRTYVEDEEPVPESAQKLSRKVKESDFIVVTTPEYNHSFPGILKTALDYLYTEYEDKPFGFVTVSAGGFGGVRSLSPLHDIVLEFKGFIGPDLQVSRVGDVLNKEGELVDEAYSDRFQSFVEQSEKFREKLENGI